MSIKKLEKGIILLLWCAVIFLFSHASGEQSQAVSDGILECFFSYFPPLLGILIRKLAHFTEYLLLAYFTYNFVKEYKPQAYFETFIFCALYAISDEIHQLFVVGRSAQWSDVIIDLSGVLTWILIHKWWQRKQAKEKKYFS